MRNFWISSILFLGVVSACTAPQSQPNPVAEAPGMQELFTPNELEDLNAILRYFEGQICQLSDTEGSLQACYEAFGQQVKQATLGDDYLPLEFEAQRKMLGSLHAGTQATFWNHQIVKRPQDSLSKQVLTLVYQPEGKLMDFFQLLGEEYVLVQQYVDQFAGVHTINSTLEAHVLSNFSAFNWSDVRVRVFLALHFVTVNDQYKRKFNPPTQVISRDTDA